MKIGQVVRVWFVGGFLLTLVAWLVHASSHRETPFITELPKADGTDFYLFRGYEPGQESFVTLIANYVPLHAAYGGPNYFFHAGMIAHRLGGRATARACLAHALALNPHFHLFHAEVAAHKLKALGTHLEQTVLQEQRYGR